MIRCFQDLNVPSYRICDGNRTLVDGDVLCTRGLEVPCNDDAPEEVKLAPCSEDDISLDNDHTNLAVHDTVVPRRNDYVTIRTGCDSSGAESVVTDEVSASHTREEK